MHNELGLGGNSSLRLWFYSMFYEVYPIFAIEVEVIFNLEKYG